jgi:hypothetical protein
MGVYKSEDGNSSFEVENTDFHNANGSKNYGFLFKVKSRDFSIMLKDVWFYDDDLSNFIKGIDCLNSGKGLKAELKAMSDFVLVITPTDTVGHFAAKFSLADAIHQNSANLTVKIDSQSLGEFASELQLMLT